MEDRISQQLKLSNSDDLVMRIDPHWLQFSPPQRFDLLTLGSVYLVVMVIGLLGNGMVIFLIIKCKPLRTLPNVLVFNLAVGDILIMFEVPVLVYHCFWGGQVLGPFVCDLYGFIGGLSGTASITTLASISLDRYTAVKYPLNMATSTNRVYLSVACSWANALLFSSLPLFNVGLQPYQHEGYLISCSFDYLSNDGATRAYIFAFFIAAFLLPLSVITFSYYNIFQVVAYRYKEMFEGHGTSVRHFKENRQRKEETKLALTVFVVILLWLLSWTPYAVVAMLGITGQKHLITPLVSMVPAVFCKSASALDPYVYALSHPKFKDQLRRLFSYDNHTHDAHLEIETLDGKLQDYGNFPREIQRGSFKASLFCLKPTFANKSSSFRKLTRRVSLIRRRPDDIDEDQSKEEEEEV